MKMNRYWLILFACILVWLLILCPPTAKGQHIIQLSGTVLAADSALSTEGVSIFVPGTTRGTYTKKNGFFSMAVLPGDSIVLAAISFERQYVLIPKTGMDYNYTVNVLLKPLTRMLPTVDVMPWATERDLRMAIANVRLPKEHTSEVNMEIIQEKIKRTVYPMDSGDNFRNSLRQIKQQQQSRYMVPTINLISTAID